MSASKLSYRVRKHLSPHLESLGFKKSLPPREWVRITNRVMCAIAMSPSPTHGQGYGGYRDVTKGSFQIEVGVAFPALNFGFSDTIDQPERGGIGWCDARAMLTRSLGVDGPKRFDVWDPSVITPDEAINDAITAINTQATQFFNDWTNPEYAYDQLLRDTYDSYPVSEGQPGVSTRFVRSAPNSYARLEQLAILAAAQGRTEDEIDQIERLHALVEQQHGHKGGMEHTNKRLAELKGG